MVCLLWEPNQPAALWLSLFAASLAYGGIGVMLGAVLRGELEGMFLIIMLSIIDATLQNPLLNPASDSGIIRFLPFHGSMQAGVAAGFLDTYPLAYASLELVWFLGSVAVAGLALRLRSRDRRNVLLGSWTAQRRQSHAPH